MAVTPEIATISKSSSLPLLKPKMTHAIAGGQGMLHSMDECGMNGVKKKAIENAVIKARTAGRLRGFNHHEVTTTTATPRGIQIQGAKMASSTKDFA